VPRARSDPVRGTALSCGLTGSRNFATSARSWSAIWPSSIAIANVGGSFYAVDDTCTHQGCSLATGYLDGTTVTCLCHSSEFDVTTGAVLSGPAEDPLASYPVRIEGDDLQVEI
jgi:3-phenylpropionate/trans-cinnamate dioxygenase ferredoxin subunit